MQFLDQLFIVSADPSVLVLSSYDPLLVLMSLCIAVFTSGMALQLAGVARDSETAWWRQITILTGSLALGAGVWSMHFIGMLAFKICGEQKGTQVMFIACYSPISFLPHNQLFAFWFGEIKIDRLNPRMK